MKYIKGNQTYKLEDCKQIKIRLIDNDGFAESPWAARYENLNESVLQNHAIAFIPHESWGAVLPTTGNFNFLEMLKSKKLTLHPEAWDAYIKEGVISEKGNWISEAQRKKNKAKAKKKK